MLEFYPAIKLVHVTAAITSGAFFLLRGVAANLGSRWSLIAPVRYLSYSIDIVLLIAGLLLLSILPSAVFGNGWLALKLALLVVYIVLGTLALKRGRTARIRQVCLVAAMAVYGCVYLIARTHDPLGPARLLVFTEVHGAPSAELNRKTARPGGAMSDDFPYEILSDADELSSYRGWDADVYRDFLAVRDGTLSGDTLSDKYRRRRAVFLLDMTGLTSSAIQIGELESLLRVLDAQRVCIPVLKTFGAELIRCFADDIVAIFDTPDAAVDAAFEIHHRIDHFRQSGLASEQPTQCCVGIGYGDIFAIGPNLSQGDEMNRTSKLGEDIARGEETLVTENVFEALQHRGDIVFERQDIDDLLFPFYRAEPA